MCDSPHEGVNIIIQKVYQYVEESFGRDDRTWRSVSIGYQLGALDGGSPMSHVEFKK